MAEDHISGRTENGNSNLKENAKANENFVYEQSFDSQALKMSSLEHGVKGNITEASPIKVS